ncbi:hypothetical protein OHB00_44850 [Streptomyces sp. NBC_00631]|uniref:hypothetical protein n=1 Tax=Streptomyces sp. NBC_00631 TaxID=2975793 RepID=UPI0030E32139
MRWQAGEGRRREVGLKVCLMIARFPEQRAELGIADGYRKHIRRLLTRRIGRQ